MGIDGSSSNQTNVFGMDGGELLFTSNSPILDTGTAPLRIAANPSLRRAPVGIIQSLLAEMGLTAEQVQSATPVTVVSMCVRSLEMRAQSDPTDHLLSAALSQLRLSLQSLQAVPTVAPLARSPVAMN
jgi:hypothetical protein